jgi:hypothetical protein
MLRVSIIAALLLAVPATPAIPAVQDAAQEQGKCADTAEKKAKRSMFGSMLGGLASGVLGRAGGVATDATNEAIRGGVGTEVKWTSETRQNVTGSSKVTGQEALADGTQCMTVTDVVIIDGEETTVPKRMCRGRGDSGYKKA